MAGPDAVPVEDSESGPLRDGNADTGEDSDADSDADALGDRDGAGAVM